MSLSVATSSDEACAKKLRYASESAISASGLRAERGTMATRSALSIGASACRGASESTTCALVPLIPNELTPAILGLPFLRHGTGSTATLSGSCDHGIRGLGVVKC